MEDEKGVFTVQDFENPVLSGFFGIGRLGSRPLRSSDQTVSVVTNLLALIYNIMLR